MTDAIAAPRTSAPPDWIDAVSALAIEHDLPELMGDLADTVQVSGSWQLHPWQMGRDITALVEWALHLDDPAAAIVSIHIGTPDTATIIVSGHIAGVATDLVGCTHRPMGRPGRRPLASLREPALEEIRARGAEVSDPATLDLAQQLDPLNRLGPVTA